MTEQGSFEDATVSETTSPPTDLAARPDALHAAQRAAGIRLDGVSKRFRGVILGVRPSAFAAATGNGWPGVEVINPERIYVFDPDSGAALS